MTSKDIKEYGERLYELGKKCGRTDFAIELNQEIKEDTNGVELLEIIFRLATK